MVTRKRTKEIVMEDILSIINSNPDTKRELIKELVPFTYENTAYILNALKFRISETNRLIEETIKTINEEKNRVSKTTIDSLKSRVEKVKALNAEYKHALTLVETEMDTWLA